MGKERRGGSKSAIRARRTKRRLVRILLFGAFALGLGGIVGGLVHLGMYGVPGMVVSASPGGLGTAPDPSTEVDAQERARDWSRALLLKLQPVLDERRKSTSPATSPLPTELGMPEALARGQELLSILRADLERGVWAEVAPGLGLYLELLARLPELGELKTVVLALEEDARKVGAAGKDPVPPAITALAGSVHSSLEARWESFLHGLVVLEDALSKVPVKAEDREMVQARLDILLQAWVLSATMKTPAAEKDRAEARKRALGLVPRSVIARSEDAGAPADRSRISWRARVLLELIEEALGVPASEEKDSTAPFAEGVMVSMVAGEQPDDKAVVAATEALVQSLLTFENGAVDPADIEMWANHLQKLRGKKGALSRLKVGLTRLWMRKVLDRLEEEAQSVSLLKPWTAAKLIQSGQSFLDTTSLVAREFPEQIEPPDWIAIYDTSDRGLAFLQNVATNHGQFVPPGARKGIQSFEKKLEESQSAWSNEADPLRYLLASCLRLTIRGRVPQLLEPGPSVSGDQVTRLVQHLEAWASKDWLASPAGGGVRQRLLSLGRFLDETDPARAELQKAFTDRTASSR